MAEYALIFTREAGSCHRVLGLLSSAFSGSAGAKQTKLPLCSWLAEGGPEAILTEARTEAAPLDPESRAASLRWILACEGCPFADALRTDAAALARMIVDAGANWRGFHIYSGSQALEAEALIEAQGHVLHQPLLRPEEEAPRRNRRQRRGAGRLPLET